jgi:hypothetical protein
MKGVTCLWAGLSALEVVTLLHLPLAHHKRHTLRNYAHYNEVNPPPEH